ncbi:hypothetical protein Aperf_G00000026473 [Anoplocephala perfoliata]
MALDVADYSEKNGFVSKYGWKKKFSDPLPKNGGPFSIPRFSVLMSMVPDMRRYISDVHIRWKYQKKSLMPMDLLNPLTVPPIYGVPLGGIGCGTIGRGYKGEFCRTGLIPGRYNYDVGAADQFILTVKREGKVVYHQVLSCSSTHVEGLQSWKWSLPTKCGEYIGLYPRSWTIYNFPELKLALICKQVSPVIPRNYKDSSLPCGVFQWTALNFDAKNEVEVAITMTWRGPRAPKRPPPPKLGKAGTVCSEIGHLRGKMGDEFTLPFDDADNQLSGCLLETFIDDMPCCFGTLLSADVITVNVALIVCLSCFIYTIGHHIWLPIESTCESLHDSADALIQLMYFCIDVTRCLGFTFGVKNATNGNVKEKETGEFPLDISTHPLASVDCAVSATEMWTDLGQNGYLTREITSYYVEGKQKNQPLIGVAVCASFKLCRASSDAEPGQETCEFYLTWHMPRVHFRSAIVAYKRRYTRWFSEDTIRGASELLTYASKNAQLWNEAIDSWQNSILEDSSLPNWYKSAIFNELYYISDGGTVWLDPLPDGSDEEVHGNDELLTPLDDVRRRNPNVILHRASDFPINIITDGKVNGIGESVNLDVVQNRVKVGKEMGLFGYLEGHEYRMYNTYDVHFNASWAFIKLWPLLQQAINYDLADLSASEDRMPMKPVYKGTDDTNRVVNFSLSVPHDAGNPEDEPFYQVNGYDLRATDEWKDLNPKFILITWRDWKLTEDDNYLFYMLPIVLMTMENCREKWDKDDDGLIENGAFPDQTYDMWKAIGLSAYIGCLWLAALYATKDMLSYALSKTEDPAEREAFVAQKQKYGELLSKAKTSYYTKLWAERHCVQRLSQSQIHFAPHWF